MKRWLILLSLWPAASYATPDSKAMTVDSVSCAVQAVDLADGHEREVLIHRGAADGAVVGWRGKLYAVRPHPTSKKLVVTTLTGSAEVVAASKWRARVRVKLTQSHELGVQKGDAVQIKMQIPALKAKRSLLWELTRDAILFKDVATKKPRVTYRDLYAAETPDKIEAVYAQMVASIKSAGVKHGSLEELSKTIEAGRYKNRRCRDIMEKITRRELIDYLSYVRTFRGNYYNRSHYVEEMFAGWVLAGAPYSEVELVDKMMTVEDPAERASLLERYPDVAHDVLRTVLERARGLADSDAPESQRVLDVAEALARARKDDKVLRWHAFSVAYLRNAQDQYRESAEHYMAAAQGFAAAGEPNPQALCHHNLGVAYDSLKEFETALAHYERAQEIRGEKTDVANRGLTERVMGDLLRKMSRHLQAIEAYKRAEGLFKTLDARQGLNKALTGRALSLAKLGRSAEAAAVYKDLLDEHRATGECDEEADTLANLGSQLWNLGKYNEAYDAYGKSLAIRRELKDDASIATALTNMGRLKDNLGRYAEALGHHQEARDLRRKLEDPDQEAEALADIARVSGKIGDHEGAFKKLHEALAIEGVKPWVSAYIHTKIAQLRQERHEYTLSRAAYDRAVQIRRDAKATSQLASALRARAGVSGTLRDWKAAFADLNEALAIAKTTKELGEQASCMHALGTLEWQRTRYADARVKVKAALDFATRIENRRLKGICLRDLGRLHSFEYDFAKATKFLNEALDELEDPADRGFARLYLSGVKSDQGLYAEAMRLRRQVVAEAKAKQATEEDARILQHGALIQIGKLQSTLGELAESAKTFDDAQKVMPDNDWFRAEMARVRSESLHELGRDQEAFDLARQSMELYAKMQNDWGHAAALHGMGTALQGRGDSTGGLPYLRKALPIARRSKAKWLIGAVIGKTAQILFELKRHEEAAPLAEECVAMFREIQAPLGIADALVVLGRVQRARGEYDRAAASFKQATKGFKGLGAKPFMARALTETGILAIDRKDYGAAITAFDRALSLAKSPHRTWQVHFQRSRALELQGKLGDAATDRRAAVAILDTLRAAAGNDARTQKQFLRGRIDVYESMAELLGKMIEGETDPKERGLLMKQAMDFVAKAQFHALKTDAHAAGSGSAAVDELLETIRRAEEEIARLQKQIRTAQEKGNTTLEKELTKVLATKLDELSALHDHLSDKDPDYGARVKFDPLYMDKVRALRPWPNAKLLIYFPARERLLIWIYAPPKEEDGDIEAALVQHAISRAAINGLANRFRKRIKEMVTLSADSDTKGFGPGREAKRADDDWYAENCAETRTVLRALYDALIAPVHGRIKDADPLLIVPYGSLNFVPFDALMDSQNRFLAETVRTAYFVHNDNLKLGLERLGKTFKPRPDVWVGYIDPIGKLGTAIEEGLRIEALFQDAKLIAEKHSQHAKGGRSATKKQVFALRQDCTILHFATHGVLNGKRPAETYLQLAPAKTPGSDLSQGEIPSLRRLPCLKQGNLRLVVLSACNTARAQNEPQAEMLGMPGKFHFAGARAVVASLWQVRSSSTSRLMVDFYGRLIRQKQDTATALQGARLKLLGPPAARATARYAHPFFWSPFLVFGDWR